MKLLVAIAVVTVLLALYVVWGRTWLKSKSWMQWLYTSAVGEWIEINLFRKSETILFARFKVFIGAFLTLLTQIGAIDITPLMPFIPDEWEPLVKFAFNSMPLIISVMGMVDEKLRKDTTKPLEQVELPTLVPANVAAAMVKADEAKAEVVAAAATMPDVPPGVPLVKAEQP